MEDILIEFKNVTKRFGARTILNRVNLKIYDGQVTTIIGKSGTGKSVLLKHIIGLLSPDEGSILVKGKPLETMSRMERDSLRVQLSYCFQNNALFDSLTVFENIALPLQQTTKIGRREIEAKVMEKIQQLELSEVPYKYPSELSGGMQKRVALARALITEPKIVLFDEPTTGQDPIRKNTIMSMVVQNQKKFGFTTIMISHDIPDVFFISDRVLILYGGEIIFQGTYAELDQLQHPMVDEFVKSLEGFEDELTDLSSNKPFTKVFKKAVSQRVPEETVIVAMISIDDLDALSESVGNSEAEEIIQSLEAHANKHFGEVGLSNRFDRDKIATIFPSIDLYKAKKLLYGFSSELEESGLMDTCAYAQGQVSFPKSFPLRILGGLAVGTPSEDIEVTIRRAEAVQKEITTLQCEVET